MKSCQTDSVRSQHSGGSSYRANYRYGGRVELSTVQYWFCKKKERFQLCSEEHVTNLDEIRSGRMCQPSMPKDERVGRCLLVRATAAVDEQLH